MRKPIVPLAAAWLVISVSCWQYNNPVDPAAASYQGYEAVRTVAEVKPYSPADGATAGLLILTCVYCASADLYALQIADSTADFSISVYQIMDSTSNTFDISSAGLAPNNSFYWRVKARDKSAGQWAQDWSATRRFSTPLISMVSVTGGTFQMGSASGSSYEQPVHSVTLSSFLIGKYEVTQSQYQQVIGSNPAYFTSGTDAPNRPVEQVTWYETAAFCNALTDREGFNRVYTISGTSVTADFTKNGYRLPTEAEWEFAARGGTQSQGYAYSGSNTVDTVGWYSSNSVGTTHPIGTKTGNELRIHDMSGNVWEWCWDWYGSYSSSAQTNPTGATSGSYRVLRGGSWFSYDSYLRSAGRDYNAPGTRSYTVGFRVVRRQD